MSGRVIARPRRGRAYLSLRVVLALAFFAAGTGWLCPTASAQQQLMKFPKVPWSPPPVTRRNNPDSPMLLQATEIQYDQVNKRVVAVGNVQIYHRGSTLLADRVIYHEVTKRMHAEGKVRLTDAKGQITYGDVMDLSDDFRDGFVDALRLDTPDRTRMAAARADRAAGNFTVLHSGVYTACEPCKEDPKKPPLWQVKAARIIHDQGERMIYFENAQIEFFGQPVAYLPYFSAPDPTVKRKTGFLFPFMGYSTRLGTWLQTPYYWALAPDYDLTFTPRVMSRQGVLLMGEWRQRLENGAYSIRLSGLNQLDSGAFPDPAAQRDWRGAVDTKGAFALSDKWTWGWDALLPSDPTYLTAYSIPSYQRGADVTRLGLTEGITQIFLVGRGDRSYFDVRTIYYYGFSTADTQNQIPVIHPVLDYQYIFNNPIWGGELSFRTNLISLSRTTGAYDPITTLASTNGLCAISAAPGTKIPANCVLHGIPGTYTRFSAETQWKRTYTDSFGQVFTPFAKLRADAAAISIQNDAAVSNHGLRPGDSTEFRVMPTVGVEYRYPLINVQSWGTQTIEPIAQIIVRPNEQRIGKFPNEDAQSLMFDDGNLFKIDKFTGWDRMEGGGRANVGLQYTAQVNRAGFFNVLFGQSYQMFGTNSFAVADVANTGLQSGLDTNVSDYVARVAYQPDRIFTFSTRYRFDRSTFEVRRFEAEARTSIDRWTISMVYGIYDAQPLIGFPLKREGIMTQGSVWLGANWMATGMIRYDIDAKKIDSTHLGLGYIDDCLIIAMNYIAMYSYGSTQKLDHRVVFQIALRTLGTTGGTQQSQPR